MYHLVCSNPSTSRQHMWYLNRPPEFPSIVLLIQILTASTRRSWRPATSSIWGMLSASESCQGFIHLCARGWDRGWGPSKQTAPGIQYTTLISLDYSHPTTPRTGAYSTLCGNCRMSSQIPKAASIHCIPSGITDIIRSKARILYGSKSREVCIVTSSELYLMTRKCTASTDLQTTWRCFTIRRSDIVRWSGKMTLNAE